MINDSTKRELWKSGEGRCARCGRPLVYEETVIDHIFPKSLGGADHIDNLRLLCKQCNSKLSNRAYFSEYAFKEYLKQFLDQDVRFENVCMDTPAETSDGQKILFDITFTRKLHGKEEMFAIEVKEMLAATDQRILSAIRQLSYDEYKITYALRNFQHVDDVFDGISVRLGMPAQIYAHRQRLLDNSRFTAPQRAAFAKLEECFDLFPIFKTAKEQLEQIEKKLMFYTVTPEQENKAIDALKFKEELCGPHGVLLLGKLLDPNGNELEATDSTIIKLAQEQSEASLSYQDEIPWGVCRLLQLFQGTNYQDI